jgi:hypothetical protein
MAQNAVFAETVLLTATVSLDVIADDDIIADDGHDVSSGNAEATAEGGVTRSTPASGVARAHHYFTKMKVAELKDPQIKLAFGSNFTVTVTCTAPAPHVFLDPGELKGHFSDNGLLLLPGEPVVLTFDPVGEAVTTEMLRANVVVRSPYSTMH